MQIKVTTSQTNPVFSGRSGMRHRASSTSLPSTLWLAGMFKSVQGGLQVLDIDQDSPLRQLEPVGNTGLRGSIEKGDRIVAINGDYTREVTDLDQAVFNSDGDRCCEITIFDHRTRMVVTWKCYRKI